MKAKHIVISALMIILPFVIVLGFGNLGSYLSLIGERTYMPGYTLLSSFIITSSMVAYTFWLSFVMRTTNQKAKVLLICCSLAVAVFFLIFFFGYWVIPFPIDTLFISPPALICAFSNLFAGIYMLCKGRKVIKSK